MACVPPNGWDAADALYCALRQHHLQGFGQWDDGALLRRPQVRRGVERVLRRAAPAAWRPEDALLDASWVPRGAPDGVRRFLSVPPCTHTASLYVYLVLQLVLQLYVHLWIRGLLLRQRRWPRLRPRNPDPASGDDDTDDTDDGGEDYIVPVPVVLALVVAVSVALSRLTVWTLRRTVLPFAAMPNLFFHVGFTVCLSILMRRTEQRA